MESFDIKKASRLLTKGRFKELSKYAEEAVSKNKNNLEAWKFWGIALGSLEETILARKCFETVLKFNPSDEVSLCNFLITCFANGDKQIALKFIKQNYDTLSYTAKEVIKSTLGEALNCGDITVDEIDQLGVSN